MFDEKKTAEDETLGNFSIQKIKMEGDHQEIENESKEVGNAPKVNFAPETKEDGVQRGRIKYCRNMNNMRFEKY